MQITMDNSHITSIAQIQKFLNASQKVEVSLVEESIKKKYPDVLTIEVLQGHCSSINPSNEKKQ
jgi:hypothetical protein